GQPPLYRIRIGKKEVFKYTEKDKEDLLKKIPGNKAKISRFKGLGEMPPELLWNTTMDPSKRKLVQVKITDAVVADQTFDMLMVCIPMNPDTDSNNLRTPIPIQSGHLFRSKADTP
ncbi:MAG: hypothetical protein HN745_28455, partial [Deltaproteobacteria bacterium]|nr:hypothetical protein [Deltaproteobacteria bacterium]